eukprot:9498885-Pyramimonas_sp.AAC.1
MKQDMVKQAEAIKDSISEFGRNGRWPTGDLMYYLVLKSRAQPSAQDPNLNVTFNDPMSGMLAMHHQSPRQSTFRTWL